MCSLPMMLFGRPLYNFPIKWLARQSFCLHREGTTVHYKDFVEQRGPALEQLHLPVYNFVVFSC